MITNFEFTHNIIYHLTSYIVIAIVIVIGFNFKIIIKRPIPFLIGDTITGSIMAYYYGLLFTIIVNSIMWYVISYLVSKYYYKSKGINDQKYLIQYDLSKIKSRNRNRNE